ncbi:anti-phage deoxyguanosine triphosphatase, partial [Mitsuaria sp. BK037]|uniref:anti-phage deoxyguanosine triphosphatase n=1 Tax=Mitsuaria sp. BK037 TaxID=2587122 RepID=UPI001C841B9A
RSYPQPEPQRLEQGWVKIGWKRWVSIERESTRVIHSSAFRRLQAKTQVLGIGEGDFHRTRLTHSMEVAQIARGIVRMFKEKASGSESWYQWLPGQNLIEAIALCHDLGHPPFGHGGEVALNFAMREAGGFEGNGQTLRLVSSLEAHTEGHGLDLTRRTLLGVLKYPAPYERVVKSTLPDWPISTIQLKRDDWKPPKCFLGTELNLVEWIMDPFDINDRELFTSCQTADQGKHSKTLYIAFDTSIMELADDIAYGVHDFEDAIALRMVVREDWQEVASFLDPAWATERGLGSSEEVEAALFGSSAASRKQAIGGLVNAFIISASVRVQEGFSHPLLNHRAELEPAATRFLDGLKDLVVRRVIRNPQVQTLEYRGQQIVVRLFEALQSDPERLLKESFQEQLKRAAGVPNARMRVVCDYIAGMTDGYATRMFERLFIPRQGQFSDRF